MRALLEPHPDSRHGGVERVAVQADRFRPRMIELTFVVSGRIGELVVPGPGDPKRADGLWRTTCFEAFVRARGAQGYIELNLSPSTSWAAYRFDGFRTGMRPIEQIAAPRIEVRTQGGDLALNAVVDLGALIDLQEGQPWRIGLSAVIEQMDGGKSYWALAHPPGPPDFHHADCFAGELLAPGAA